MTSHRAMWERLRALDGPVDLLVVGGGINGAGIARDAARRGLSVALLEMHDLAFGTSSRSSKLVHGGLRYLEQFEFTLVFEAVSERRILQDIAPHLVRPLGFLFPVYRGSRHNLLTLNAGMWLYDGLSLFRSPKLHERLTPAALAHREPILRQDGLRGAPLYWDCATDDARLVLENALDAAHEGAIVLTGARVDAFERSEPAGDTGPGTVCGARLTDLETGEVHTLRARAVVNATGPWTDRTLGLDRERHDTLLRPTKGIHAVVPADRLPLEHAVVCFHPTDGRVLFALPWGDAAYLGTTDTDFTGDPADVRATGDDVDYLLSAAGWYFPDHPLTRADVLATWAGLRPLVRPEVPAGGQIDESAVSREHRVIVHDDGVVTIAGGKLTTYRKMAAEVVDTVVRRLREAGHRPQLGEAGTEVEPLPGAVGWIEGGEDELAQAVVAASDGLLSSATAAVLTSTYGTLAVEVAARVAEDPALAAPLMEGRPEVLAQVDHAVQREFAREVEDVIVRRTQLFYRAAEQGAAAAQPVADRMARLLGWSDARRQASVDRFLERAARARAWADDQPRSAAATGA